MELKDFQQRVLDTFSHYLDVLKDRKANADKVAQIKADNPGIEIPIPDYTKEAWDFLKNEGLLPKSRAGIDFSPRYDGVGRPVPSVCFKIPTGGGKTLLASQAVSRIMSKLVGQNTGFVLWIVPNESIYAQTRKALVDREHPYRQVLDRAAAGKVKILEKNDRLDRRDVETHLCVMLLMLQSANRETKESLRLFRDRGNVHGFFPASDDVLKHAGFLDEIPNLDVYGDRNQIGAIVKDSLGNALRFIRPVVVLDEGHRGYSKLAMNTLYDFNPCFVLELTATPVDRPRDNTYSNWLVDVRGTDLDQEEMIKLPINVTVKGGDDWRYCLRESYQHLNAIQAEAERLRADSSRYVRPICLIQVERTGKEQRDGQYIHANDAKDYLLTLGVEAEQIAIKTSEKNDLNQPENLDLQSPTNQVRFIITKQALQEGWDCPFAYILCSLASVTSRGALTQLVGRILRQPDTAKTGLQALDECYVFCHHSTTKDVITAIKNGLEQDGMGDLAEEIKASGNGDANGKADPRNLSRRKEFQRLQIFLPIVLWVGEDEVRSLDYEGDILFRIDWDKVDFEGLADKIPASTQGHMTQFMRVGLTDDPESNELIRPEEVSRTLVIEPFDATYVTRSIVDIVPNPWIAREFVGTVLQQLKERGMDEQQIASVGNLVLETLRSHLIQERDRLAEELFLYDVKAERIQFRLRVDGRVWRMPDTIETSRPANSDRLYRDDGKEVEKSLFEPCYRDELNGYEQIVACYIDGEESVQWWHRNIAKRQYKLQGWRKHPIYPDFLFALSRQDGMEQILILETKGDHLNNPETAYKKKLMDICSEAYQTRGTQAPGELGLESKDGKIVKCSLVFENNWRTEISGLIAGASVSKDR